MIRGEITLEKEKKKIKEGTLLHLSVGYKITIWYGGFVMTRSPAYCASERM
jgi:hypothetical protein